MRACLRWFWFVVACIVGSVAFGWVFGLYFSAVLRSESVLLGVAGVFLAFVIFGFLGWFIFELFRGPPQRGGPR